MSNLEKDLIYNSDYKSYRSTFISMLLVDEFPEPGVDGYLTLSMSILKNLSEKIYLPKKFNNLKQLVKSDMIESEIVDFATKLDGLLILWYDVAVINYNLSKFIDLFNFFSKNREKIIRYYPYIERVMCDLEGEIYAHNCKNSEYRVSGIDMVWSKSRDLDFFGHGDGDDTSSGPCPNARNLSDL